MIRYVLLATAAALAGCATTPTSEIFRTDTPSMKEIYFGAAGRDTIRATRRVGFALGDQAGYTREAGNEIGNLFPSVNNPRLVMYVFPHLGAERLPVPGYATAFPMYEHAALFALPGEVEGGRQ